MAYIKLFVLNFDKTYYNLLTTIKETSCDEKESEFKKIQEIDIADKSKLIIYEKHISTINIFNFIESITKEQSYKIDDIEVKYNILNENCRTSFLTQREDNKADTLNQICSPFYSNCNLIEHWDVSLEIKNLWLKIPKDKRKDLAKQLDINLNTLIDRVGNILHFQEIDEIDVSIQHQNDKFLTLSFIKKEAYINDEYIATIEIYSYDDLINKQSFKLTNRFTDIPIQDNENNIHLEVHNVTKNTCVYYNNLYYIGSGHSSSHYFQRDIKENVTQLVEKDNKNLIYSLQYNRKRWTNVLKIQQGLHFFRADSDNEEKAFDYLLKLLVNLEKDTGLDINLPEYIYLVDPYIFKNLAKDKFIKIFNAVKNIELRIIGGRYCIPDFLKSLKTDHLNKYSNVKIKNIKGIKKDKDGNVEYLLKEDGSYKIDKNGNKIPKEIALCHDRWIATKNNEYGFTNSLNNFSSGVSFFKSIEQYFDEAESLWNTKPTQDILVEELNFNEKQEQ